MGAFDPAERHRTTGLVSRRRWCCHPAHNWQPRGNWQPSATDRARVAASSTGLGLRSGAVTYSIVARCADTGQLGVAVQSAMFGAGRIVAWAEAGVAAVATQARAEVAHGPEILDRIRDGVAGPVALRSAVAADPGEAGRQIGVVDAAGRTSAHTGARAIAFAGHVIGDGYTAQANMMANTGVPEAMARAFEASSGSLALRLIAALEAAQAHGGDFRGAQAGAVRVVGNERTRAGHGVVIDVRVEDDPEPIPELRRLTELAEAYGELEASEEALGAGDLARALELAAAAAPKLPRVVDAAAFHSMLLLMADREDDARAVARQYHDPDGLRTYLGRLADAGIIPLDEQTIAALFA
jgi:uncharacterized Ntn-hydrolase superfamily protein